MPHLGLGQRLAAAIEAAGDPAILQRARSLGAQIAAEDGPGQASGLVERYSVKQ